MPVGIQLNPSMKSPTPGQVARSVLNQTSPGPHASQQRATAHMHLSIKPQAASVACSHAGATYDGLIIDFEFILSLSQA
jgi:hypothetical protein